MERSARLRGCCLFCDDSAPRGEFGRTLGTLSNVAQYLRLADTGGMKRTVQVNVKMTQEDFELLKKAAEKRWPDAVITNSGIVLALAKIAARQTLGRKKR